MLAETPGDINIDMKTISVAVSPSDYHAFQEAAKQQHRSTAQLIREAMAVYRKEHLQKRERLEKIPVLSGHKALGPLPDRGEVFDEIFASRDDPA